MGLIDNRELLVTPVPTVDNIMVLDETRNPETENNKLQPLVAHISDKYQRAKHTRQADDARHLRAYRNYRGEYGPDTMFTDEEKSRFFVKVTKTKVLAAYAQINDILFAGNKFPIGIEPTPVPNGDLPDNVYLDPKEATQGDPKRRLKWNDTGTGYNRPP